MLANAAIAELTASSKENSSRAPIGTPNTYKVSSVHERRCKAEENDELIMQSRDGGRPRIVASRDSKASEIRSRISGKQTADSKKEREKLGPGDDNLIRMRVFNSYKQIKFSGVGIGGKPAIFSKPRAEAAVPAKNERFGDYSHIYGANALASISGAGAAGQGP